MVATGRGVQLVTADASLFEHTGSYYVLKPLLEGATPAHRPQRASQLCLIARQLWQSLPPMQAKGSVFPLRSALWHLASRSAPAAGETTPARPTSAGPASSRPTRCPRRLDPCRAPNAVPPNARQTDRNERRLGRRRPRRTSPHGEGRLVTSGLLAGMDLSQPRRPSLPCPEHLRLCRQHSISCDGLRQQFRRADRVRLTSLAAGPNQPARCRPRDANRCRRASRV